MINTDFNHGVRNGTRYGVDINDKLEATNEEVLVFGFILVAFVLLIINLI